MSKKQGERKYLYSSIFLIRQEIFFTLYLFIREICWINFVCIELCLNLQSITVEMCVLCEYALLYFIHECCWSYTDLLMNAFLQQSVRLSISSELLCAVMLLKVPYNFLQLEKNADHISLNHLWKALQKMCHLPPPASLISSYSKKCWRICHLPSLPSEHFSQVKGLLTMSVRGELWERTHLFLLLLAFLNTAHQNQSFPGFGKWKEIGRSFKTKPVLYWSKSCFCTDKRKLASVMWISPWRNI